MRILLTGSAGQVGGALLPLLRERAEVVAPLREQFDLITAAATPENLADAAAFAAERVPASIHSLN